MGDIVCKVVQHDAAGKIRTACGFEPLALVFRQGHPQKQVLFLGRSPATIIAFQLSFWLQLLSRTQLVIFMRQDEQTCGAA